MWRKATEQETSEWIHRGNIFPHPDFFLTSHGLLIRTVRIPK